MKVAALFFATIVLLFGLRLVLTALQSLLSGKVLVRRGIRTEWQPAPAYNDVWKVALRDGLMGVLLIVLGVMLIF